MQADHAPFWLPGGHLQTIWAAVWAQVGSSGQPLLRERWLTPDGDFIDVDVQSARHAERPMLVLFHGLEGSSQSHYARAFAHWAAEQDVHLYLPHFRGCSGEINHAPRAYHSGDHEEIDWILQRCKAQHPGSAGCAVVAAGVSLGGNALMRWAGETGERARDLVQAVASICSPLDLQASGRALGRGFNRWVYTRLFLQTMKPKALAKWAQYPQLFDRERLLHAQDLHAFDDVFTAPLHGFRDADDYWYRASARRVMRSIRIPALALNARNDPFVPEDSLLTPSEVSSMVQLDQPSQGGHVGFAAGDFPGHLRNMPMHVGQWLLAQAGQSTQEKQHG